MVNKIVLFLIFLLAFSAFVSAQTNNAKKQKPRLGIVNGKAIYLPKPVFPKACRCKGTINVQVVIDKNGKVIRAYSVSGHPLLRASAVLAARQAKFPPLMDVGKIRVKGLIVYKFKPDGTIEF